MQAECKLFVCSTSTKQKEQGRLNTNLKEREIEREKKKYLAEVAPCLVSKEAIIGSGCLCFAE